MASSLLLMALKCTYSITQHRLLTVEDVELATPVERAAPAAAGVLPGLLVEQATHLSSVAVLLTIQVGHSHDPVAGLNFWDSSDYKAK